MMRWEHAAMHCGRLKDSCIHPHTQTQTNITIPEDALLKHIHNTHKHTLELAPVTLIQQFSFNVICDLHEPIHNVTNSKAIIII